jgi:hypothetical protein
VARDDTLCLKCGFSPIPDGAEACPKCGRPFAPDRVDFTNVTGTRLGGLTGAVTASPQPVALALALGAVPWVMRGLGLPTSFNEPVWTLAIAVGLVAAAAAVMANLGPVKHLAALVGVLEIGAALVLGPVPPLLTAAAALHGAVLVAATVAEPGRARLWAGAAEAAVAVALGAGALATATPQVKPGFVYEDEASGVRLALAPAWRGERRELFPSHLRWPLDGGKTVSVGFLRPFPEAQGVLLISRDEQPALPEACAAALKSCGVTEPLDRAPGAEVVLPGSLVGDVRIPSGAAGRALCGLHAGRFIALVVVAADPAPGEGTRAFDDVVKGLSFGP